MDKSTLTPPHQYPPPPPLPSLLSLLITHPRTTTDDRDDVTADRQQNEDHIEVDGKCRSPGKGQCFLQREKISHQIVQNMGIHATTERSALYMSTRYKWVLSTVCKLPTKLSINYNIMLTMELGGSLKTSLKENNFRRYFDQMV